MAARKWTDAQRAAQAAAIHEWQPWTCSTGATSSKGKSICSKNAYRGGGRPFARLINKVTKALGNLESMTEKKADEIIEELKKLSASR